MVGVSTLLIGTFGAIYQTRIKRLLAYSTISHVGFILIGFSVGSQMALESVFVYLIIYTFVNFGIFAVLMLNPFFYKNDSDLTFITDVEELRTIFFNNPLAAAILSLLFLSLAGVPPLAGFFTKYSILISLIDSKMYNLAIICVLSSVVSAFYYLRLIKFLFFLKPENLTYKKANIAPFFSYIVPLIGVFNFFFIFFFDIISDLIGLIFV